MKTLFERAYDAAKTESTRFWTVFSLMSAINGVMLAGFLFRRSDDTPLGLASIFGIAICLVWFGIQRRLGHWVTWWDKRLGEVEEKYVAYANHADGDAQAAARIPDDLTVFRNRKPKDRPTVQPRWPGISTRLGGCTMPVVFMTAWSFVGLGGNQPMAFDLAQNLDEILKLLTTVSAITCLYFGYQLLQTALVADTGAGKKSLAGLLFAVAGIVALGIVFYKAWLS